MLTDGRMSIFSPITNLFARENPYAICRADSPARILMRWFFLVVFLVSLPFLLVVIGQWINATFLSAADCTGFNSSCRCHLFDSHEKTSDSMFGMCLLVGFVWTCFIVIMVVMLLTVCGFCGFIIDRAVSLLRDLKADVDAARTFRSDGYTKVELENCEQSENEIRTHTVDSM